MTNYELEAQFHGAISQWLNFPKYLWLIALVPFVNLFFIIKVKSYLKYKDTKPYFWAIVWLIIVICYDLIFICALVNNLNKSVQDQAFIFKNLPHHNIKISYDNYQKLSTGNFIQKISYFSRLNRSYSSTDRFKKLLKSSTLAFSIIILIFSIIIHEVMHGYSALICGDPTAKMSNRLTLNPIPHIDIFGSIILPLMLILSGTPYLIGWAKPVPVNHYLLRGGRKDNIFVSFAGPLSNLLFLLVATTCLILVLTLIIQFGPNNLQINFLFTYFNIHNIKFSLFFSMITSLFLIIILLNSVLAMFNLIPIPPLDGHWILEGFFPHIFANFYSKIRPYGFFIIFGIIILAGYFPLIGTIFFLPIKLMYIMAIKLVFFSIGSNF